MAIQIQLRRDTAANWTSANPILADGEAGYETDTGKIKLGDGVTAWTSLAYRFLGVLDHGALTGLGDDDHTQYHNDSRALTWLGTRSTSDLAEGTNLYFTETRVRSTPLTGLSVSGSTITATDTVLVAFGALQNQINGLLGGVSYQGVWNATTNSPSLTSSVGTKGYYYVVSVAGSTNLDGITDWKLGDWVIFNGATWDKVDNTDAVMSVNGATGAVTLTTSDISEGTNLYFTDERAQDAVGTILADSSSIDFTYDDGTPTISAVVLPAGVDHNSLNNYDANKHVDHTAVTLTAGNGLSGGGDISSSRTFDLDLNELTTVTAVATDLVSIVDVSDTNASKKALISDIVALGSGSYLKLDASNGPLTGNLGITKADPKLTLTDTTGSSTTVYLEKLTTNDGAQLVSQNRRYQPANALHCAASGGTLASFPTLNDFSVSVWINSDGVAFQNLFSSASSYINLRGPSALPPYIRVGGWGASVIDFVAPAGQPAMTGRWTHVVITRNATTGAGCVYYDGVASPQNGSNIGTWNGGGTPNTPLTTNGSIDEMIIYNKVLSQSEVTALYAGGAPNKNTNFTNVTAQWSMDQSSGTTATDVSGNGRNVTSVTGSSWVTGKVADTTPQALTDIPLVKIANNGTPNSYGDLTFGYYTGSYGTDNYYDGLNHYHRILGTTRLQVTSSGITVTGAATLSSITASTLTISGALTMSGAIAGATSISFTNGAYGNAGLVGTPTYSASSDTNTGMYFPAADTLGWSTGGTERMRITSAGHVGIGLTPTYRFQVYDSASVDVGFRIGSVSTTYSPKIIMSQGATEVGDIRVNSASNMTIKNLVSDKDVGIWLNRGGSDTQVILVQGTTANVGIGANTTLSAKLHVVATTEQFRAGYDTSNYFSTTVSSAGAVTLDAVGASAGFNFSDPVNITSSLQCDSIVNDTGLAHGTYTPTLTGVTNVASSTARQAYYTRIGNVVTVYGQMDVAATANNTQTTIGISLPIASALTTQYQLSGTGHSMDSTVAGHGAVITADAANDRANFDYYETHGGTDSFAYSFSYEVL